MSEIQNSLLFLLIIPAYYLISLLFFLYPQLIWKQMRYKHPSLNDLLDSNKIFCIGHRGGARQGTQNTLQCFLSNEKYCNIFELDVHETKDKILVVHHDEDLFRSCGVATKICNLSYDQLPRYQKQFKLHFTQELGYGNNNKIPKLQQIFKQFPQKIINIELKSPTDSAIKELDNLVRMYSREDITIWGIINNKHFILKQLNPAVPNFYNASQIIKVVLLYITGLLPFWCLDHGVLQMFLYNQSSTKMMQKLQADSSCCRSCLFSIIIGVVKCLSCISGPLIRHLKKRGILTFLFVLNEEQDYSRAISKSCSGIMTDRPKHLYEYLTTESLLYFD